MTIFNLRNRSHTAFRGLVALVPALLTILLLAACGQAQQVATPTATQPSLPTLTPTMGPGPSPSPTGVPGTPPSLPATVELREHPELGPVLTDATGRTLYLFTRDERNVSNCSGNCLNNWPPLLTSGDPAGGEGVAVDRLGAIDRGDGTMQATYNGWPLYYYAQDSAPGDANGQNVGDVWFVVSSYGGPIQNNAAIGSETAENVGPYLADASGRTLYLFSNDRREQTNCSGNCALNWPPVLTVGDPTAGEGVAAERLGTVEREDGTTQVTYNGWPLYYFFNDAAPGDAAGQSLNNVWWYVSTYGGPIFNSAEVKVTPHEQHGEILTDATGRTLYLFTNDSPNTTNCSGNCALNWPPLLTIEDPTAGDGANGDLLGVIERADGTMQVTYNGWPLYYFFNDAGPGDAMGQDVGGVWYVVDAEGNAVE